MSRQLTGRLILGVAAGFAAFFGLMATVALVCAQAGIVEPAAGEVVDLSDWLLIEVVGGSVAGLLAGLVSRRVGRIHSASAWLAVLVFALGVLEGVVLQSQSDAGRAAVSVALVWIAPFVGPLGILAGSYLSPLKSSNRSP